MWYIFLSDILFLLCKEFHLTISMVQVWYSIFMPEQVLTFIFERCFFSGYRILGWQLFSFSTLKILLHLYKKKQTRIYCHPYLGFCRCNMSFWPQAISSLTWVDQCCAVSLRRKSCRSPVVLPLCSSLLRCSALQTLTSLVSMDCQVHLLNSRSPKGSAWILISCSHYEDRKFPQGKF